MSLDPLEILTAWHREAVAAEEAEPDAMTLATASPDGRPSARIVLFRGLSGDRVRFFTNYESHKGRELAANPRAALLLFWPKLHRQLRFEGAVERLDEAESDAYFAARPRGHQLQAWASRQSEPIASLDEVEARHQSLTKTYEGQPVPRPPYWGGYGLRPVRAELWVQGGDRLHERRLFLRGASGWSETKLSP